MTTDPLPPHRPWTVPALIVRVAVWFAIVAAWVELGILGFRKYIQDRPSFGMPERVSLLASHRVFWTVPLAEALVFLVPAILVALLALKWPGRRTLFAGIAIPAVLTVVAILFNFTSLHPGAVMLLAVGVGVQTARTATNTPWFPRFVDRSLKWMVAAVLVSGVGATGWTYLSKRGMLSDVVAPPGSPNVLLIILDTVREFSLSTYGYERETSPNLTRLAASGVLFSQAYATAPWTLPSHASIFTGRQPFEMSSDLQKPLDYRWPTLAEQMNQRGYSTAGFVANIGFTNAETGLARGFQHYEDRVLTRGSLLNSSSLIRIATTVPLINTVFGLERVVERKDADRVNRDFLRWVSGAGDRPFFVFLNYYDAHKPYQAPRPYSNKYLPTRRRLREILEYKDKRGLPEDAGQLITDAYDGTIAYLDDRIGRLMSELDKQGKLKNTIVIITSDHGEQFGEHGFFYHGNTLYTQLLRVPLIIFGTSKVPAGTVVPHPVSLREIAPTVLDLVDGSGPDPFPGRSLALLWSGEREPNPTTLPPMAELGGSAQQIAAFAPPVQGMWSVVQGDLHYIRSGKNTTTGVPYREELYNVARDPRETTDLTQTDSGRVWTSRLRQVLDSLNPAALRVGVEPPE